MKYLNIPGLRMKSSNIIMGCMHLNELNKSEANTLIHNAIENGINFFDHADGYANGLCESLFAEAIDMNDDFREKVIIQSKCGIRKDSPKLRNYYDFSRDHILAAVDASLQRLQTDYLDVLLLHRPDALVEPDEVGEAFDRLQASGKVRSFGVSNQYSLQMELLQSSLRQKLDFNQVQLSIAHTPLFDAGIAFNMGIPQAIDRTGGMLEYSRLNNITLQAWSPFQWGMFAGVFLGDYEHYEELIKVIDHLRIKYPPPAEAIVFARITSHPANIQVIIGTTKPERQNNSCLGSEIKLTKEEWYILYKAAGNPIP